MSVNLIMFDSAPNDPRSVSSMLCNHGDGREQVWLDFEKSHASLSQENVIEKFSRDARYGRVKIKSYSPFIRQNKFLTVLIILIFIVF